VFVELDQDIHGLAHISELSYKLVRHPGEVVKVGETRPFKILTIEPDHHRLGLSLKALEPKPEKSNLTTETVETDTNQPIQSTEAAQPADSKIDEVEAPAKTEIDEPIS
jgi:small subunit ribosomal protein S1